MTRVVVKQASLVGDFLRQVSKKASHIFSLCVSIDVLHYSLSYCHSMMTANFCILSWLLNIGITIIQWC